MKRNEVFDWCWRIAALTIGVFAFDGALWCHDHQGFLAGVGETVCLVLFVNGVRGAVS